MSVTVAVPVFASTIKMYLEKGRQWSIVEHMLLYAVCQQSYSGANLSQKSNIQIRVVIEVMIRLMRAGWVELINTNQEFQFQATSAGKAIVEKDTLPAITRPITRKASYAVDRLTGTVFRSRDLILYNRFNYEKLKKTTSLIEVPPRSIQNSFRQDSIITTLLDDDEQCRNIDIPPGRPSDKFALFTVSGENIEGLPARAPESLRQIIFESASLENNLNPHVSISTIKPQINEPSNSLTVKFDSKNFIIGPEEHLFLFKTLLQKARSRIIIHTTFLSLKVFKEFLPLLNDAAQRRVKVDIMWGKSDDNNGVNSTQIVAAQCRELITNEDHRERITIHNFSTGSHAKILVADNQSGVFSGVIGSCNWLNTSFDAIETSLRFEDPLMVSELVSVLSKMAAGPGLVWPPFATELAILSSELRARKFHVSGLSVKANMVLGSEHNEYMRRARDEAKDRILVVSHRFSQNAETLVLIPAKTAISANNISVNLYYGRFDGTNDGAVAAKLERLAIEAGLKFKNVLQPRLHAKVLAWDNDSIVVTSQNWLSADVPFDAHFSEIGVYLVGNGLAKELIERIQVSTSNYFELPVG